MKILVSENTKAVSTKGKKVFQHAGSPRR